MVREQVPSQYPLSFYDEGYSADVPLTEGTSAEELVQPFLIQLVLPRCGGVLRCLCAGFVREGFGGQLLGLLPLSEQRLVLRQLQGGLLAGATRPQVRVNLPHAQPVRLVDQLGAGPRHEVQHDV